MNFLIFRDFLEFFLIFLALFGFIFNLFQFKNIKNCLKLHADVAANAEECITCRHLTTCARARWRTCVCVCVHTPLVG